MTAKTVERPFIIHGKKFKDERGFIFHNNSFDLNTIRRMYEIQNLNKNILRGWKGHIEESRWFYCTNGEANIKVRSLIDEFQLGMNEYDFTLNCRTGNVLYVPKSHATLITLEMSDSRILCFSDYSFEDREKDIRL